MKLTKSKLKQIIKEELEQEWSAPDPQVEAASKIEWLEERVGELFERIVGLEQEAGIEWRGGGQPLKPLSEGWDRDCMYTFDDVRDEYYKKGGQRYGQWGKKHSSQMDEAEIMANEKRIRGPWC